MFFSKGSQSGGIANDADTIGIGASREAPAVGLDEVFKRFPLQELVGTRPLHLPIDSHGTDERIDMDDVPGIQVGILG